MKELIGKKKVVLVVGYMPDKNFVQRLVQAGYAVEATPCGVRALDWLGRKLVRYDAVVLGEIIDRGNTGEYMRQSEILRELSYFRGGKPRLKAPVICIDSHVPRLMSVWDLVLVTTRFETLVRGLEGVAAKKDSQKRSKRFYKKPMTLESSGVPILC